MLKAPLQIWFTGFDRQHVKLIWRARCIPPAGVGSKQLDKFSHLAQTKQVEAGVVVASLSAAAMRVQQCWRRDQLMTTWVYMDHLIWKSGCGWSLTDADLISWLSADHSWGLRLPCPAWICAMLQFCWWELHGCKFDKDISDKGSSHLYRGAGESSRRLQRGWKWRVWGLCFMLCVLHHVRASFILFMQTLNWRSKV